MVRLTDESICPFGKFKGTRMIDVPAYWLIWALENTKGNVAEYAKENEQILRKEKAKSDAERAKGKSGDSIQRFPKKSSEATPTPAGSALSFLLGKLGTSDSAKDIVQASYERIATIMDEWKKVVPIPKPEAPKASSGGGFFSSNREEFDNEPLTGVDDMPF